MRRAMTGFWLGVVSTAALMAAAGGTAVDVRLTTGEPAPAQLEQRVDQPPLAGLLEPAAPSAGTLHIKKRSWGIMTVYSQTLATPGAGDPGAERVRVLLALPGATASNADGREGRALLWRGLPGVRPQWAEAHAVDWPFTVFIAGAAAVSLWLVRREGR